MEVILADRTHQAWLAEHAALLREELNVKQVEFAERAEQYISYTVLPDLKRLGPRLGKQLPAVKAALAAADTAVLMAGLEADKQVTLELAGEAVTLDSADLQIRLQAKPGWAAAQSPAGVVVLATSLTPELRREGLARELIHAIQTRRKELQCKYTDRIRIGVTSLTVGQTKSQRSNNVVAILEQEISEAVEQFSELIRGETLAVELQLAPIEGVEPEEIAIGDTGLEIYIEVVAAG